MRRAMTVLAACLCAITGCRGGAAQKPYEAVAASTGAPAAVPLPAVQANEAEPMASEVDIPWTIALLSDGATGPAEVHRHITVVEDEPQTDEPISEGVSVDFRLAIDNAVDQKPVAPTTPKICPGVVKGRS